ncbi:alpha/beta fold hydrolase [Leifsonia sp. NPDC058230]|uniref:alpha/beta fold hydrolase n=1 Tax=Leifsonia sp. NPDC058230 TaxID=3346391 RepID=UPI0036D76B9F
MSITSGPAGPIHWTVVGSGPAVVLLHGLGGDADFWEPEIAAWSGGMRLIAIDLRGSGGTPSTGSDLTIADLADDVVAVLDDAGVDSAHVVGFSLGGLVAQEFALRHPDRLNRLVLVSTYARMHRQAELFLDAVLAVYEQDRSAKHMFDLIVPWLFSPSFVADPDNAPYFELPDDAADDQSMEDWRALYLAQKAFDARGRVASIHAPTLLVAGELDALVPVGDAKTLASEIPRARLHVIVGSGHLVNTEQPEQYHQAVFGFLTADDHVSSVETGRPASTM